MAKARIKTSLAAFAVAGALIAPAAVADFAAGNYVTPGSKAAGLSSCVRDTRFMRRNHMELIEHQRDLTVHQGIRSTTEGLAGCIECHVAYDQQKQPLSVDSDGQFCNVCHEFAAVDVNCFGCHATVPTPPGAQLHDQVQPSIGQAAKSLGKGSEAIGTSGALEQMVGD